MALADLIVLNRRGATAPGGALPDACVIGTCLREVRVATLAPDQQPLLRDANTADYEQFAGAEGYRFLLQLACGLESEIAGETEILGQIKQSWRDYEIANPERASALRPWMQRLLQDTKEIRSEFVVGLGSATYGSLVRRLLGGATPGTTLMLGAGQLAETILPYLDAPELLIHNRSTARARAMVDKQRDSVKERKLAVLDASLESELAVWQRAHDVVVCVPADETRDAARVDAWLKGARGGRVLHLGMDSAEGTVWQRINGLCTLRDLFNLRDTQASARDILLARARKACLNKALLAKLDDADGSRPGNSNHGWEDLAVFQAFSY
jgi:Glutamyl-tRNAGlu reductase, N-terminal domain